MKKAQAIKPVAALIILILAGASLYVGSQKARAQEPLAVKSVAQDHKVVIALHIRADVQEFPCHGSVETCRWLEKVLNERSR